MLGRSSETFLRGPTDRKPTTDHDLTQELHVTVVVKANGDSIVKDVNAFETHTQALSFREDCEINE